MNRMLKKIKKPPMSTRQTSSFSVSAGVPTHSCPARGNKHIEEEGEGSWSDLCEASPSVNLAPRPGTVTSPTGSDWSQRDDKVQ